MYKNCLLSRFLPSTPFSCLGSCLEIRFSLTLTLIVKDSQIHIVYNSVENLYNNESAVGIVIHNGNTSNSTVLSVKKFSR